MPCARLIPGLLSLALWSCAGATTTGSDPSPAPESTVPSVDTNGGETGRLPALQVWGGMREVLREGHTEGRVVLQEVVTPNTVAVGALEGLAAEITIVGGTTRITEVRDPAAVDGIAERTSTPEDRATLLILAEVPAWTGRRLPEVADLAALEVAIQAAAAAQGLDPEGPFPFLVDCRATWLRMHVLNHSCPIADPEGPPPWQYTGEDEAVTLVGFLAVGQAGILTHHGQSSHVHAVLAGKGWAGHLDEVSLAAGARLFLPGS